MSEPSAASESSAPAEVSEELSLDVSLGAHPAIAADIKAHAKRNIRTSFILITPFSLRGGRRSKEVLHRG